MKKKIIMLGITTAVFTLGLGLVNTNHKQPTPVEATQHLYNYDQYFYDGFFYESVDFDSMTGGLDGTLRQKLTAISLPKGFYSYSGSGENTLSYQLQGADEDPTDSTKMVYFYTRDSVRKNAASSWNREHVWPQSKSNGNYGEGKAGADILHIRPTYDSTNSSRGSLMIGDTGSDSPLTYSGMAYGFKSNSMFEPLDSVKGDMARIFMYVWTAYKNEYSSKPMSMLNVIESYDTLLKWHMEDKPDALEGHRNDYAENSKQKNRNPFVDHPEYAWKVFGDEASATIKQQCMETYPADGTVKTLFGLSITGEATKKNYYVGDTFNPDGLTVTAYYTDDSTRVVPNSDCVWTPNPLTEGLTEVTWTYGSASTTYSGITVTKKDIPITPTGDTFNVVFKSNSSSGSGAISVSSVSGEFESNTLVDTVTEANNVYRGTAGLRIGSRSNSGSLTFKLKEEARHNIEAIQVKASKYNEADTGVLLVKYDNTTLTTAEDSVGVDFSATLNDIDATTITIGTSSGRTYIKEVIVIIKDDDPIDPPPSSSSSNPPSSSSSASQSSSESSSSISSSSSEQSSSSEVSSSENSSYVPVSSSSEPSSSHEESSSIPSSSSMIESSSSEPLSSSSEEQISSSEQQVSSSEEKSSETSVIESSSLEPSSSNNTSSESGNDEKSSKGCGGSIVATLSLTSFSALIGLVFVLSKKKR